MGAAERKILELRAPRVLVEEVAEVRRGAMSGRDRKEHGYGLAVIAIRYYDRRLQKEIRAAAIPGMKSPDALQS